MKSVKKPEIRKKELIDIAQKQFIERGYEKTSIRSIVGEANGEIGMFYHYFTSKEEIFNSVLEHYNSTFVDRLKELTAKSKTLSFFDLLKLALFGLEQVINEYSVMQPKNINSQMLIILHHNALLSIQPIFRQIIEEYANRGEIKPPNVDTVFLTDFLLYGISAIIHEQQGGNMDSKIKDIFILLQQTLGTRLEG